MSALRFALLGGLMLVIGNSAAAEEKAKIDKAKLVGTWKLVKTDYKEAPEGLEIVLELTKDGKMIANTKAGKRSNKMSGTYTVKGDQWTSVLKGPDGKEKSETVTITVLTDKKLVTTEDADGKKVTTVFEK